MAPDSITRRPNDRARPRALQFLFDSRLGQIFSLLILLKLVDTFIIELPLGGIVTLALWVYALAFLFRLVARLRGKLLWKIRRKLFISYLLIGLVPTVLILFFFLLSAFFLSGQMSSYMLNTELARMETQSAATANMAVTILRGQSRNRRVPVESIRESLAPHVDALRQQHSGAELIFLQHRRERIQRIVATGNHPRAIAVGTGLPKWMREGYKGPVRIGDKNYLAAVSTRLPNRPDVSVLALTPLEQVLAVIAEDMGLRMDKILTSVREDDETESTFIPSNPITVPGLGDSERFTLPWIALYPAPSWLETTGEPQYIFVQFGFSPLLLYQSVATNALQLGPGGEDAGRIILTVLAVLAAMFLVIEVIAIVVGLFLARSIIGSVHALSQGTEHVRQGDFSYKVRVRSQDQLGELADSFNLMTTSIQDLLNQSAEKERLEEELRIARGIQMSLLPRDRVSVPGLSIAALCLPATEVGGDYYDFLPMGEDRLAMLIADVSGKGTSAALYMAEIKGLILSLSRIYDSPRKLLVEANTILGENMDSRSFVTMAYAVIDVGARRMTFARAGHNPILHVYRNGAGTESRLLAPNGLGLALDRSGRFESILVEDSVALEPGDFFLFFTDGVTEAMNPHAELFGEDRLRRVLESNADLSMEQLREKMVDEVFSFSEGAVQHDDMTMVLVKVL